MSRRLRSEAAALFGGYGAMTSMAGVITFTNRTCKTSKDETEHEHNYISEPRKESRLTNRRM
jgi:hypothetical protein